MHRIIAKLLDVGVKSEKIGKIYESNSFDKLKLLGYSSEKLEIICNGKVAYIVLTRKDLLNHNYRKGIQKEL